jgi:ribokinase
MVVVFGSINIDLVTRVARFPAPGETLTGASFELYAGGKGANQAIGAARAGAQVRLYGALGRDALADTVLATLSSSAVATDGIARVDGPSGCATILVSESGENCIVVVPGANQFADPSAVPEAMLGSSTTLVLQQEVPARANASLIARAKRMGARIVLNAAPAQPAALDCLHGIDVLIVNETEAEALAAQAGWPSSPKRFATACASAHRSLTVIVTLGAAGALAASADGELEQPAPAVDVFDTTGAGDAFVGTLAAALNGGIPLTSAMQRAVEAASHACTLRGARQPCTPPASWT